MPKPTPAPTTTETGAYATSAGLDVVSGVFGYLATQASAEIARTRADMIRASAEADAQRYAEQAAAHSAQTKVMYLASGVTLAGSPLDALDTQARVAKENYNAILMGGEVKAFDEEQLGGEAESKGRNALVGGFGSAAGALAKGFPTGFGGKA